MTQIQIKRDDIDRCLTAKCEDLRSNRNTSDRSGCIQQKAYTDKARQEAKSVRGDRGRRRSETVKGKGMCVCVAGSIFRVHSENLLLSHSRTRAKREAGL